MHAFACRESLPASDRSRTAETRGKRGSVHESAVRPWAEAAGNWETPCPFFGGSSRYLLDGPLHDVQGALAREFEMPQELPVIPAKRADVKLEE